MAKRVFISFVDEDRPHVNGLRLLASNPNVELEFYDESLQTAIDSSDAEYIKSRIRPMITRAGVTVCLIGPTTHTSGWVDWELEESAKQAKAIIAMAVKGVSSAVLPRLLRERGVSFYSWDVDLLARLIETS